MNVTRARGLSQCHVYCQHPWPSAPNQVTDKDLIFRFFVPPHLKIQPQVHKPSTHSKSNDCCKRKGKRGFVYSLLNTLGCTSTSHSNKTLRRNKDLQQNKLFLLTVKKEITVKYQCSAVKVNALMLCQKLNLNCHK